jgi:hypothetical protein
VQQTVYSIHALISFHNKILMSSFPFYLRKQSAFGYLHIWLISLNTVLPLLSCEFCQVRYGRWWLLGRSNQHDVLVDVHKYASTNEVRWPP